MNNKRKIAWLIIGGVLIIGIVASNFSSKYQPVSETSYLSSDVVSGITEKTISGNGSDKIAVIRVDGQITDSASQTSSILTSSSTATADDIVNQIDKASSDSSVKALILEINSPGGSAVAGQTILARLEKFRDSGKKLYVAMREVAASAAYEISLPADAIYANPETETGSIGVIMEMTNYQGLYDKLGLSEVVIKSGDKKDMGNPDRQMTKDEQQILQSLVDSSYNNFVKAVAKWRKMDESKVRDLADGRIYSAQQALDLGLIDKLGNMPDVVEAIKSDAGLKKATVVEYQPNVLSGIIGRLFQKTSLSSELESLLGINQKQQFNQLMHLWAP